jgi:hypothetical protein
MNLDLSDEESAALTEELHHIVESDRYPAHPHAKGDLRQAQAGAGPRALATAEDMSATASNRSEKATLTPCS